MITITTTTITTGGIKLLEEVLILTALLRNLLHAY